MDVLEAYRLDQRARADQAFGEDDGAWIQLALLLAHAASSSGEVRVAQLRAASELGRSLLGDDVWRRGYRTDPEPPADVTSLSGRIRSIAETMEEVGALQLSDTLLEAFVAADGAATTLERARVEIVRARLAWKADRFDVAAERYRRAVRTARQEQSVELRVRILIGRSVMTKHLGNYPRSRLYAGKGARLAERAGLRKLAAVGYHSLMVGAAVALGLEAAIVHGWRAYELADGDTVLETEVLGNMGQVFLDAGHPVVAISAFRVVIQRSPSARILLPARGGLAIAAARLGLRHIVHEQEDAVTRNAETSATSYDMAYALLDLARARQTLGDSRTAEGHRFRSLEIASRFGFHELVHHTSASFDVAAPVMRELPSRLEAVAVAVQELVHA
ncbi:MAG: hypothetical protein ABJE47_01965 [bacterium]